jgi:preprotein translocase subunit SecA
MRSFVLPFDWLARMDGKDGDGAGRIDPEAPSTYEGIVSRVREDLGTAFERRVEEWKPDLAQQIVRRVLIGVIDEKWREHLYELDQLKSGIQYRAWGQRDPLIEYKKEAFEMFVAMMEDLRTTAASVLFRVKVAEPGVLGAEERRRRERLQRQQVALKPAATSGTGVVGRGPLQEDDRGGGTATATQAPPQPQTFVREHDKVGRNDPCPCGSGKKYKKCHGA